MRILALLLSVCLVAPDPARGHPHVFIDGGADFIFSDGRLTALRITWTYDAFATLYYLQEMGVDPDGDMVLSEAERTLLVEDHTSWIGGFEGDSYLSVDGTPAPLSGPYEGRARLEEGRLSIVFLRALETPVPAEGLRATAKLYDPTFFIAYSVTLPPLAEGIGHACRTRVDPFDPESDLVRLQSTLSQLSREETPEDPNVGALFADEILIACE